MNSSLRWKKGSSKSNRQIETRMATFHVKKDGNQRYSITEEDTEEDIEEDIEEEEGEEGEGEKGEKGWE